MCKFVHIDKMFYLDTNSVPSAEASQILGGRIRRMAQLGCKRLFVCPNNPNRPWQNRSKIAGGDQVCGMGTMVPFAGQSRDSAAGSAQRPSAGTAESTKVGKTPAPHGFSVRAACPHPATRVGSGSG